MKPERLTEPDYAEQYRRHMRNIGFTTLDAGHWDEKAPGMNQGFRQGSGDYAAAFLRQIHFNGISSVLDVGCGPGTLALAIARKTGHVYCLDHSRKMLDFLAENARNAAISNYTAIHLTKEDDWQYKVPHCDIVVCSRAGMDADLGALLLKLSHHAHHTVYFSYPVGGGFMPPLLNALLKREQAHFPDYIYPLNILYQMGFDPNLSFVTVKGRLQYCTDWQSFRTFCTRQYPDLTEPEYSTLHHFFTEYKHLFNTPAFGMKWALINWQTN